MDISRSTLSRQPGFRVTRSRRPSFSKATSGSVPGTIEMFPLPIVHALENCTPSTTQSMGGFGTLVTAAVRPL
ncbi:MAG TPA: hypothetical protein VI999_03080 [Thermoplasmata archaeon]|nr:hypothetical protein [Thermoplasmata archaeon]